MSIEKTAIRATYFSIIGNTCMAIVKGLAGFFGNSYALIADAIESTTDIFASFLVLFGIKYSNRPADENHPYGHGRADDLIAQIRVVSLKVDGILDTEKCFIRKAGMQYHVDLHATVDSKISVKEGHDLAHKLKDTLRETIPELGHVLIHVEPNE